MEVRENSVCILVEKSRNTDAFLPTIKELIIDLLLEKSHHEKFRFNIAYFDKEPTFWADQVTDCTSDNASSAAQWIRSWASDIDHESIHTKPRTMMAMIAALNDPFVGAIYLLTSSAPFENPSDLINHVKYASKDRPIHIMFMTARSKVDEKAMEILHSLAKKTDGTFHAAYYDENGSKSGRLIKIPAIKRRHKFGMHDTVSLESISPNRDTSPIDFEPRSRHQSLDLEKSHRSSVGESFRDLIISTPHTISDHKSSITIPVESKFFHHEQPQFQLESTRSHIAHESFDHSSITDGSEIDEIKKDFVEYYWRKRKDDHGKVHTDHPTPKMVDFEPDITDRRPSLSSQSSVSSISSSDLEEQKLESARKTPVWHRLSQNSPDHIVGRRYSMPAHTDQVVSSRPSTAKYDHTISTGSRPSTAKQNKIPVTIYSKSHYTPMIHKHVQSPHRPSPVVTSRSAKPAWRPPTGRKHFVTSPKSTVPNAGTEDRSRAWMNRWMNEWVKRHEPTHGPNKTHASIQADVGREIIIPLHRSKSEPRRLHVTTYTQTPHEEKRVEEEIHTIRDLLVKNHNLLDSMNKASKKSTPRKNVINDFERPRIDYNPMDHTNGPLRINHDQSSRPLHIDHSKSPRRIDHYNSNDHFGRPLHAISRSNDTLNAINRATDQANHWHKSRLDYMQSAMERKEEIRRQREQECYKAMYHKLAGDVTRRNASDTRPQVKHAFVHGDEKMELIAKLPYKDTIYQG